MLPSQWRAVLWFFKLPGKRKWLFLWWKQVSLGRKKSILFVLFAGNFRLLEWAHSFESTYNYDKRTLEACHCSQLYQLVFCVTCDCIGKRDKWRKTGLEFHLFIFVFFCCAPLNKKQQKAGHHESSCGSEPRASSATANSHWGILHRRKYVLENVTHFS